MIQPLNTYLVPGPQDTASDMHVQSGYPIWNLVADWIAQNHADDAVVANYGIAPAEWAAAKEFYLKHKAMIDARIILNQEPIGQLVEGLNTPEDFFTWAAKQDK
jgi:hypothetical protein